jgi:hypothetical protein
MPRKDKLYPLAESYHGTEEKQINLPSLGNMSNRIMAQYIGEFRPPKKGEWYLSGSQIEAYQCCSDSFTTSYHIARIVLTRKIETIEIVKVLDNGRTR